MGLLLWIVRILALLLLLRFVLQLLFGNRGARKTAGGPAPRGRARGPELKPGGELVRDPNCGTYVAKARAIAVSVGSETVSFCSATDRDAYRARASA